MSLSPRDPVTSAQNPRVRQAIRLRDRKHRDREKLFLIDGAREIRRALAGKIKVQTLFVCDSLCDDEARLAAEEAFAAGAERIDVTPRVSERIAFGARAEGILAVAETPGKTLADLPAAAVDTLIAVIEGVEKPGNLGAIFRTADAAGVTSVIVANGRADLFNPNAIRASLGTVFCVPAAVATPAETIQWLRANGLPMIAARVDATLDYTQADFRKPCAILLGSEAEGLSDQWKGATGVRLPMRGAADSLNVSVAAAVLFYEALRQRTTT